MTKAARDILAAALGLSSKERVNLAHKLLASLELDAEDDPGELDPDFAKEIDRRLKDIPAHGKDWPTVDEVLARARRDLKLPSARVKAKRRRGA